MLGLLTCDHRDESAGGGLQSLTGQSAAADAELVAPSSVPALIKAFWTELHSNPENQMKSLLLTFFSRLFQLKELIMSQRDNPVPHSIKKQSAFQPV